MRVETPSTRRVGLVVTLHISPHLETLYGFEESLRLKIQYSLGEGGGDIKQERAGRANKNCP